VPHKKRRLSRAKSRDYAERSRGFKLAFLDFTRKSASTSLSISGFGLVVACTLLRPTPATAQTIATSPKADSVTLTVYRAPYRGEAPINKNWPQGYALITETRTINIPAGESVIRFEGVSEGLFPETAIVTGLPKGVREKNRDARLLSPAGLVDAFLKREVKLSRTDKATGKTVEETAMVTAGPNGLA
jgi:hypothetical protein